MKTKIIILIIALALLGGIFYLRGDKEVKNNEDISKIENDTLNKEEDISETTIKEQNDVEDLSKTYVYKNNGKIATVDMSSDGNSVVLNYENIKDQKLDIAMSASGARYTNSDESIVFWNKGEDGMILINDKVVFDTLKKEISTTNTNTLTKLSCEKRGGTWYVADNTCEKNSLTQTECTQQGGEFNECASACRHDKAATMCTMQCVLTCTLK